MLRYFLHGPARLHAWCTLVHVSSMSSLRSRCKLKGQRHRRWQPGKLQASSRSIRLRMSACSLGLDVPVCLGAATQPWVSHPQSRGYFSEVCAGAHAQKTPCEVLGRRGAPLGLNAVDVVYKSGGPQATLWPGTSAGGAGQGARVGGWQRSDGATVNFPGTLFREEFGVVPSIRHLPAGV